jgi:dTDP-4-amino-4,6-dideoxygalactose transaminase
MEDHKINVTQPFLPPIEEYMVQVKRAYNNKWLTNRGELVLELENKLQDYLGSEVKPLIMNNGTIPLQIALNLLGNRGEIITTPFSYVATTSSIVWEGCTPVFVDIDSTYWTIDETKIEAAITYKTTCILATHVFGNPCNVEEIERIAKVHGLFVIYDAAHCFGVTYKGKSIFDWGDISTCSFHATKIFHTGEGGAVFVNNVALYEKVYYSHNFGHNGPEKFHGLGINGKISELNAAMGLAVLPYMDEIIAKRKGIAIQYFNTLNNFDIKTITLREGTNWNFSYFPILLKDENQLLNTINILNENNIFPRRYFYPSLHELPYINSWEMAVSKNISSRVLCLPMFKELSLDQVEKITDIINGVFR